MSSDSLEEPPDCEPDLQAEFISATHHDTSLTAALSADTTSQGQHMVLTIYEPCLISHVTIPPAAQDRLVECITALRQKTLTALLADGTEPGAALARLATSLRKRFDALHRDVEELSQALASLYDNELRVAPSALQEAHALCSTVLGEAPLLPELSASDEAVGRVDALVKALEIKASAMAEILWDLLWRRADDLLRSIECCSSEGYTGPLLRLVDENTACLIITAYHCLQTLPRFVAAEPVSEYLQLVETAMHAPAGHVPPSIRTRRTDMGEATRRPADLAPNPCQNNEADRPNETFTMGCAEMVHAMTRKLVSQTEPYTMQFPGDLTFAFPPAVMRGIVVALATAAGFIGWADISDETRTHALRALVQVTEKVATYPHRSTCADLAGLFAALSTASSHLGWQDYTETVSDQAVDLFSAIATTLGIEGI
ncbi:hypothetical protein M8C13_07545 [Crossiella sp. SN42]|uniref:hypothetical protein n=1 Tax=Crossiella sp. SN42 TaxID=2944808 RepID=UPI00207C7C32|nr:hypothetical protein [Crossiella sp. SN42]MCO1575611.1 hypothetical protein [Crossiella sp. SN42]